MRVCIVSEAYYTPHFPLFTDYTEAITRRYCELHNVGFSYSRERALSDCTPHHDKSVRMLNAFSAGYDYAIWIDADAAPVGFNKDIKEYIINHPQRDKMQMVKDGNGWNNGVFLMPNNETSIRLLMRMRELRHNYVGGFFDQQCMVDLLNSEFQGFCIHADMDFGLNNYAYKSWENNPNLFEEGKHWCLHLPAWSEDFRDNTFYEWTQKLNVKPRQR